MNKKILFIIALVFTTLLVLGTASAGIFEFFGGGEDTVRIGYIPSDHDAALFFADANGNFKNEGLNVDLIKFNNGNELMKAIENNEIDIGYVGIAPAICAIANDGNSKIISAVQNEGSALVVNNSSGIAQVSDLSGKSIAIPGDGSIQELLLSFYLQKNEMSIKDLNVTPVKANSMIGALQKNEIDGVMMFQPYVSLMESKGDVILVNSSEILPNHPCCVMVASDKIIKDNPAYAKKVVSAHKQATKELNNKIKQGEASKIVEILPDEIVQDKEIEISSLESLPFASGISDNFKSGVLTFQKLEMEKGSIKVPLSQDHIFWEA